MKNLSSFGLLLCFLFGSFESFGQQIKIDSAEPFTSYQVSSVEQVNSSDSFVTFGWESGFVNKSVVSRFTSSGNLVWSKTLSAYSRSNGSTKLLNGDFVGVGQRQYGSDIDAMLAKIDPSGSIVFSKTFASVGDTTEYFDSATEDANGNIYIAGQKGSSASSRDIILKFSPAGSLLWSVQIPSGVNDRGSARFIHARNDSLFVLGSTFSSNGKDIALTVLNTSGVVLTRRIFNDGSNADEIYLDGAMNQHGMFFSFISGGYLSVAKVSWATLSVVGQPKTIVPSDNSILSKGILSLRGTELYVSGGAVGVSYGKSFAVKLNQNLGWQWGVLITPAVPSLPFTTFGTASVPLANGDIAFVDVYYDNTTFTNRSVLTELTSLGGANDEYCNTQTNFVCDLVPVNLFSTTQNLTAMSLVLVETVDSFVGNFPLIAPCPDNNPLAVTLIGFDAKKIGEEVLLQWSTGSESDNSHFQVFRSGDNENWLNIGQVTGAGDSQMLIDYELVDKNPLNGFNYYRLVSVDTDGSEDHSDVIVVEFTSAEVGLLVYPNPVSFGQTFNVEGEFESLQVFDSAGRRFEINKIANQWALSADANPGMYILVAVRADGSTQTTRIVIQ